MADNLVNSIKESVQDKIDRGEIDGDINWQILTLVSDVHSKVDSNKDKLEVVEDNVSIKVGNFTENNKFLAWAIAQVIVFLLVVTSFVAAVGFLDQLGLVLISKP